MKQSNLKVAITGLTISVCLLTGSAIATAKAGNWHVDSIQNQQSELLAMDTKFRVELAREKQNKEQESNLLLSENSPKMALMSVQVTPVQAKKAVPSQSLKQATTSKKRVITEQIVFSKKKTTASKEVTTTQAHSLEISTGNTIEYSRLIPVKATAYTAAAEENGSWGAYDYYGNPLKLGTIAVDPDVIPMGSTVYITGYTFDGLPAKGMIAKATDQGSSVQGKRVDIFVPTSQADATKFGMQDVKIYIME